MMQKEKDLADLTTRMLAAVSVKYGRYSAEYAIAGGTRRGETLRPSPPAKESSSTQMAG